MNKKIITTLIALLFVSASVVAPMAFADEVTGTLSAGSVSSTQTGGGTNGTLTGTVVGGTPATTGSTGGTTTTTSGGGGGGFRGGGIPPSSSGGGTTTTTAVPSGNEVADTALAAGPVGSSAGGDNGGFVSTLPTAGANQGSDQVAQADNGITTSQAANIPLAAAAGGIPISTKLAWVLFILLLLIILGYALYRKYPPEKNMNGPK